MNITVAVRVRPPLQREFLGESGCDRQGFVPCVQLGADGATVRLQQPSASDRSRPRGEGGTASYHEYTFDYVHGTSASQADVYDVSAKAAVESVLQGYNATIIAYGQTGSGKTHTMEGPPSSLASTNENLDRVQQDSGLIPRAISDVFGHIQEATAALGAVEQAGRSLKFLVRASYLQVYNEVISDLLKPERSGLKIREDKRKGLYVEGLSEWIVRTPNEILGLLEAGRVGRAVGATQLNEVSSRSHAVFMLIVEQSESLSNEPQSGGLSPSRVEVQHGSRRFVVGKLNLVDLAGSERVRLSGYARHTLHLQCISQKEQPSTQTSKQEGKKSPRNPPQQAALPAAGERLEETRHINQSLAALGNVISALTVQRRAASAQSATAAETGPINHVPYRDSKLTRLLADSLGGNCRTTVLATISPATCAFGESLSKIRVLLLPR